MGTPGPDHTAATQIGPARRRCVSMSSAPDRPTPTGRAQRGPAIWFAMPADLVLDVGQGSFPRLAGLVDPADVDAFVVSHLHPDHYVDLVPLRHYLRYEKPRRRVRVIGPAELGPRLDALHGEPGFSAQSLDIEALTVGTIEIGPFALEARRVTHTDDSYGFRLAPGDGGAGVPGLVYSGDCGRAEDLDALVRPGDTLLCEVVVRTWARRARRRSISTVRLSATSHVAPSGRPRAAHPPPDGLPPRRDGRQRPRPLRWRSASTSSTPASRPSSASRAAGGPVAKGPLEADATLQGISKWVRPMPRVPPTNGLMLSSASKRRVVFPLNLGRRSCLFDACGLHRLVWRRSSELRLLVEHVQVARAVANRRDVVRVDHTSEAARPT